MKKRKIILLSLIVVLAVIYGLQLAFMGKGTIKNIVLDEEIIRISITHADGTSFSVRKTSVEVPATEEAEASQKDVWLFKDGTEADSYTVKNMVNQLKNIKVLDTVSSIDDVKRYNLDENQALLVEAFNETELLRTIRIGKKAETTLQTYVQIDHSEDIVLISSDLFSIFNKTKKEMTVTNTVAAE